MKPDQFEVTLFNYRVLGYLLMGTFPVNAFFVQVIQGVFSSLEIHCSAREKTLQRTVALFVCLW